MQFERHMYQVYTVPHRPQLLRMIGAVNHAFSDERRLRVHLIYRVSSALDIEHRPGDPHHSALSFPAIICLAHACDTMIRLHICNELSGTYGSTRVLYVQYACRTSTKYTSRPSCGMIQGERCTAVALLLCVFRVAFLSRKARTVVYLAQQFVCTENCSNDD